jgi:hypothetical protein
MVFKIEKKKKSPARNPSILLQFFYENHRFFKKNYIKLRLMVL